MKRLKVYVLKVRLKALDKKMTRVRSDALRKTLGMLSDETINTIVSKATLAIFYKKESIRCAMQSIQHE